MIQVSGLNDLLSAINKINGIISGTNSKEINDLRGKAFTKYTQEQLKIGALRLKHNTDATRKIQGQGHSPLSLTRELAKSMKQKPDKDGSVDAGFFESDSRKPAKGTLTYTQIAILHSTGFRIPLTGDKGAKVRGYLSHFGIYPKKSRSFLIVSARPFLKESIDKYEERGKDFKVVEKFYNNKFKNI